MSSPWVIQVGLEPNGRCPWEQLEGDLRPTEGEWGEGLLFAEQIAAQVLRHLLKVLDTLESRLCSPYQALVLPGRARCVAIYMTMALSDAVFSTVT